MCGCVADALIELIGRSLDARALPLVGGERPHVTVVVPSSTLTAPHTADRKRRGQNDAALHGGGGGPAALHGNGGVGAGEHQNGAEESAVLSHGGAVAGEAARLLACDARVTRVVMAGASQVMDLGRTTRTVTPGLRRALVARDGGCRGCGAPPAWCHAHHVRHWAHGGATDLTNLVLLCPTCHRDVHHGGRLARGPDGRWTLERPRSRVSW